MNFVASGGTNISSALEQALVMFSDARTSTPMVYFIADGAVEDERKICDTIPNQFQNKGQEVCHLINTFGIGNAFGSKGFSLYVKRMAIVVMCFLVIFCTYFYPLISIIVIYLPKCNYVLTL